MDLDSDFGASEFHKPSYGEAQYGGDIPAHAHAHVLSGSLIQNSDSTLTYPNLLFCRVSQP